MITYTLSVVGLVKETPDTVTIQFKQPGLRKVKYSSGQFLTLIFRINGRRYVRPYSFSSCAGVDDYLEVTVKRVLNGVVSNHINDVVKVGDVIEVFPPSGNFVFKAEEKINSVYLWAAGSGITPIISISKFILHNFPNIKVNLIYGNRSHETTIFLNKIKSLQHQFPDKFTVNYFFTQSKVDLDNPLIVQGRISSDAAKSILKRNHELSNSLHYICGPFGLKESLKKILAEFNFRDSQIFSEDFELVKNVKELGDLKTQQVKIQFEDQVYNLEVVKGKTILETALEASIELPYSCQTGNCSFCKGNLVSGETKMLGIPSERNDLRADELLLCCTYPLNSDVFIKI